jgi:AmmeMemoRadiSam system protein A
VTQFDLGIAVLTLARSAIAERLGLSALEAMTHASLEQPSATFVTLMQAGKLRGCVGSLHRRRTLRDDVRANAVAAAFRDPRFAPLDASELAHTSLEVSLLTPEERIEVASEEELIARLRPGVDGVIIEFGRHHATLLPQVWEQLQDPRNFLAALKLKAGLPEDFWSSGMLVSRYAVTTWKDQEAAPAAVDAVPYLLTPSSASSS